MASSFHSIAFFSLLFFSTTYAQTQSTPKALLLQVTKDPKTLQYLTQINQRTPLVPISLAVDLGGRFMWIDCDTDEYVSSTYRFYDCHTSECIDTRENYFCGSCDFPLKPGCHNSSCNNYRVSNTIARISGNGELASDVVSILSTNGKNPTQVVSMPEFFFICTDNKFVILKGLADAVTGIAGFGRTQISFSYQFPRFLNYRRIFAICLSSSKGVIFLGDGPYQFLPNLNIASNLTYTPLIINRGRSIEHPSTEYYIGVKSIKVNGELVPIDTTLLSLDIDGRGGTTISTVDPYTILQPPIYDPFVNTFVKSMSNFTRVAPVAPFEVCYNSKNIGSTPVVPTVPFIDLVLQSEDVYWRINGANSMVQVSKDVLCLGFVKPKYFQYPSITIGGYQLENHLLQFNNAKSELGFSSSLISSQTSCANFNFTSTA